MAPTYLEQTEQGQTSVPGRFTSKDIHQALFASQPPEKYTLNELKEGLKRHARERQGGLRGRRRARPLPH